MGGCLPCLPVISPPLPKGYTVSTPLLELENNATSAGLDAPVDTVTFFRGSSAAAAAASVKARLRVVLASNPWVAGRLVADGNKIRLAYPPGEAAVPDEVLDDMVRLDPPGVTIHPKMLFEDICNAVRASPADLKPLNLKGSDLVTRITFVSDPNDKQAFAMIFQMSHVPADGHTYYAILNMISDVGKVWSMNVQRKEESIPKSKEAQGQADYDFMLSAPFAMAAVKGLLFGKKARTVCHFIDEDKMKVLKAEGKQEGVKGVGFVSTNDVLVSTFAKVGGHRLFGEAISFRNKVEGLDEADAGNYESLLWLDQERYSSAAQVRKVMVDGSPYKGRGQPLPGFCEAISSKYGVVTNWAGFAGELVIGGCAAELHFPVVPLGLIPFENACIFRPNKDKIAMLIFTKRFESADYVQGMPLAGPVSKDIFGE